MNRRRLYLLISGLCLTGYAWVVWGFFNGITEDTGFCIFRSVTGIPCPSCGSTRSVVSILHGDLTGSVHWNLLGYVILAGMILLPAWIISDLVFKKQTLFRAYQQAEILLRRKMVAVPAIMVIVANWIWNIFRFN